MRSPSIWISWVGEVRYDREVRRRLPPPEAGGTRDLPKHRAGIPRCLRGLAVVEGKVGMARFATGQAAPLGARGLGDDVRSEEHTSELQSH